EYAGVLYDLETGVWRIVIREHAKRSVLDRLRREVNGVAAGTVAESLLFQLSEKRFEVGEFEVWNLDPPGALHGQDFLPRCRRANRLLQAVRDSDSLYDP